MTAETLVTVHNHCGAEVTAERTAYGIDVTVRSANGPEHPVLETVRQAMLALAMRAHRNEDGALSLADLETVSANIVTAYKAAAKRLSEAD